MSENTAVLTAADDDSRPPYASQSMALKTHPQQNAALFERCQRLYSEISSPVAAAISPWPLDCTTTVS